jgi:hypothetical protein
MPNPSETGRPEEREPPRSPGARRPPPPPGSAEETLRRLEIRLDRASEAAERLMAQAAAAAARAGGLGGGGAGDPGAAGNPEGGGGGGPAGGGDPGVGGEPGGGGGPGGGGDPGGGGREGEDGSVKPPPTGWQIPEDARAGTSPDLDPFVALVQAMRDLIPPDLQRRLVAALREVLLALRALIDWYLERLERQREQSVEVEDIPIL